MHSKRRWLCVGLFLAATAYLLRQSLAQELVRRLFMGKQPDGSVLVSSNQRLTPGGRVQEIPGARPRDLALSPDGATLAVMTTSKDKGLLFVDMATGEQT